MNIAFTGYAGSGKSTAAKYLVDNYNYTVGSFATELKLFVGRMLMPAQYRTDEQVLQWVNDNKETLRPILQLVGEFKRKQDPYVWINQYFNFHYIDYADNVVDDLRMLNEADYLRNHRDKWYTVRIKNELQPDKPTMDHVSETEIDLIVPDWTVINPGNDLAEFYIRLTVMMNRINNHA